MDGRGRTFLLLQVFFCFFIFASTEETKQMKPVSQKEIEDCSQVQCPGPLIYYHDVGCTPVYRNQGDCCAYKYNCDHLDARSPNKCYIKHRSYEIGEIANREDINSCDAKYICSVIGNLTGFWPIYRGHKYCPSIGPNCYLKRTIHDCGPGTVTCFKSESEIPRCVVDGRTYRGGQYFVAKNEPWKLCMCQEGYTGDNIEKFCITRNMRCSPDTYCNEDIANKNAPVYFWYENPATSCCRWWRSQKENDTVIPNPNGPTAYEENSFGGEDLICKFGNLSMNIGDELSQSIYNYLKCARCICEVPPTPTCKIDYYNCD